MPTRCREDKDPNTAKPRAIGLHEVFRAGSERKPTTTSCLRVDVVIADSVTADIHIIPFNIYNKTGCSDFAYVVDRDWAQADLQDGGNNWMVSRGRTQVLMDQCPEWDDVGFISVFAETTRIIPRCRGSRPVMKLSMSE